ncbi:MAG TPA: TfpX/TfpZ family type IV pilin accessory protein [Ramlibacter sp.]|nr:TfpX/TfpZ family type IV pilin accessory protein [Ramlibacter sp.]
MIAKERIRASGLHLAISLCIAALAATLVFAFWYPYPYREVSGGRDLFLIVTTVDVILGPLITLGIFNTRKSRRELTLDLTLIGLVQLVALAYGLWTVAVARPVHLVFEFDRMRVVHSIDIPEELLARTPQGIEAEPWSGPTLLAVRQFRNSQEKFDVTMQAMRGVQAAARPDLWETYDAARPRVAAAAQRVDELKRKMPAEAAQIDAALQRIGRDAAHTAYLPVISRKIAWTAFIDPKTADIVGFAPLDSF